MLSLYSNKEKQHSLTQLWFHLIADYHVIEVHIHVE